MHIKVFSSSVSNALPLVCGDKSREVAHFVGLVDKFFDTMKNLLYLEAISDAFQVFR